MIITATEKQDWLDGANQKTDQNLIRILLCDDDEKFLQGLKRRVERFLEAHCVPAVIHPDGGHYSTGEGLPSTAGSIS